MFTILRILSCVLLLIAIPQQPMTYYFWLRIIITLTCLYGAFLAAKQKKFPWLAVLVVFIVLFNPVKSWPFTREIWISADIALIAAFLLSLLAPKFKLN